MCAFFRVENGKMAAMDPLYGTPLVRGDLDDATGRKYDAWRKVMGKRTAAHEAVLQARKEVAGAHAEFCASRDDLVAAEERLELWKEARRRREPGPRASTSARADAKRAQSVAQLKVYRAADKKGKAEAALSEAEATFERHREAEEKKRAVAARSIVRYVKNHAAAEARQLKEKKRAEQLDALESEERRRRRSRGHTFPTNSVSRSGPVARGVAACAAASPRWSSRTSASAETSARTCTTRATPTASSAASSFAFRKRHSTTAPTRSWKTTRCSWT